MHKLVIKHQFSTSVCAAIAVCLLSFSGTAVAETSYDGIYLSGLGGLTYTPDFSTTLTNIGSGNVSYGTPFKDSIPFMAGLAIGYKYGPYRYEGEIAYMQSEYDTFSPSTGPAPTGFSGKTNVIAGMANIYYDFDQSGASGHIYLGIGGGYADIENEASTTTATSPKQSTGAFAAQLIAGYAYNFNANISGSVDYRYFTTFEKIAFTGERFQNHQLNLTVSYYFG